MKVPEGYTVQAVLSPGPMAWVGLARRPDGTACVLKLAAIARAVPTLENERAILGALEAAGVAGVPRVLATWGHGFAIERVAVPTLRHVEEPLRRSATLRDAVARRLFERLAAVHAARDGGAPLDVVHGDVSPDNAYVAEDGSHAELADFRARPVARRRRGRRRVRRDAPLRGARGRQGRGLRRARGRLRPRGLAAPRRHGDPSSRCSRYRRASLVCGDAGGGGDSPARRVASLALARAKPLLGPRRRRSPRVPPVRPARPPARNSPAVLSVWA